MQRILLASAALGLMTAATQAEQVKLKYKDVPLTDPEAIRLWESEIEEANRFREPRVYIAKADIGNGRILTVTQLDSAMHCSAYECPVRVFEGDKLLTEESACPAWKNHALADEGRLLIACSAVVRTNRP